MIRGNSSDLLLTPVSSVTALATVFAAGDSGAATFGNVNTKKSYFISWSLSASKYTVRVTDSVSTKIATNLDPSVTFAAMIAALVIPNDIVPVIQSADVGMTLQNTLAKYGGLVFIPSTSTLLILKDSGSQIYVTAMTPQDPNSARYGLMQGPMPYGTLNNINFASILASNLMAIGPVYTTVSSGTGWSGTVKYGIENDTLHIKGTITVGASAIAANSVLLSLPSNFRPDYQFTHGSAINTGAANSATFSGVVVGTDGSVVNQAILAANTTYNICITCAK